MTWNSICGGGERGRYVCCQGGEVLWTIGSQEDVKDTVRKDDVVIIKVVIGY